MLIQVKAIHPRNQERTYQADHKQVEEQLIHLFNKNRLEDAEKTAHDLVDLDPGETKVYKFDYKYGTGEIQLSREEVTS